MHEALQQAQMRSRQQEEVAVLQRELDQVTDEANKRIEKGNESILKMKADLRQLRDTTEPQVLREHEEARRRLEAARSREEALARQASASESAQLAQDSPEVAELRRDLQVLENQKAALLEMVQGVYGDKSKPKPATVGGTLAEASSASGAGRERADGGTAGAKLLLPDPSAFL